MSFDPFNETPAIIINNANQNGIDIRSVLYYLQGVEISNPLNIQRGFLPRMSMRYTRINNAGLTDNTLEVLDLGQDIKASTGYFIDETERLTPVQIIQNNLADLFLNNIADQQFIDEQNDGVISIFSPNGLETPFSLRGAKSSVHCEDPYRGSQIIDSSYRLNDGLDEFLDGQEVQLNIAVPQVQSTNDLTLEAYNDATSDDTDRFGINILNSNVNLYDRYSSNGFTYSNNVRDSIAFGDLKG